MDPIKAETLSAAVTETIDPDFHITALPQLRLTERLRPNSRRA